MKVKIRTIGEGIGFIVPKHVVKRMNLRSGERLNVVPTENWVLLTRKRKKSAKTTNEA